MDFKQLQSFVTVVQEESFTQAAGKLFVSQSTVSTHIHQLESELNTKLILRTTKSLQITPKGRELYEYALNILELKERMIQACSIESRRIIHLGASTIPSAYILPQLLADFGKLHQDIYFIIHQSDSQGIINGLKDGLFNLGFIGMNCEDSDFCCQPFCRDRMVVITPVNEHFLQYKQQKENVLPELLREPLILREKGSGSKKWPTTFWRTAVFPRTSCRLLPASTIRKPSKTLSPAVWEFPLSRKRRRTTFCRKNVCWPSSCRRLFPNAASISSTAKIICCQATSRSFSASSDKANYKHNKTSTHRTNPGVLVNFLHIYLTIVTGTSAFSTMTLLTLLRNKPSKTPMPLLPSTIPSQSCSPTARRMLSAISLSFSSK